VSQQRVAQSSRPCHGEALFLDGQGHDVDMNVLAQVLAEFLQR